MNSIRSYKLIQPFLSEGRHAIIIGIACLLIVDGLQLFIPRVVKWAVDDVTSLTADFSKLGRYAAWIVGTAVVIALLRYVWRRCLIGMSRRVEEGLRNLLFQHVQTLSASYFDHTRTGDLMAHATNDINHVRMAVGMGMVALTDAVFLGVAATGFMMYIHVKLTFFALLPMPLIVFSARFFSRRMHRNYQRVQSAFAEMTETVREKFAGIRIVKAYTLETASAEKLASISEKYVRRNLSLVRITGSFYPLMILFTNLALVMVIFLGGRQTIRGDITTGDFVAFINYLQLMTWPMMALGWVTNLVQRGAASLDRINHILQTRPEIDDPPAASPLKPVAGHLCFENVSFSYEAGKPPALTGVNFAMAAGETLGIVGPPGSGKTSLLRLIPRLYDVSSGRILIDGIPLTEVSLPDLRRGIAFIPQEPFLFSGTIRENICLACADAHPDRLDRALEIALMKEMIASFPAGLDTLVGERGVVLSGGQKQRIALARAVFYDAPVLVLDDPISQVDAATGAAIIDNLRGLGREKTILIVSHRLSAVRHADRIIVMENGAIIDSGDQELLMSREGGYYAATYRLQQLEEAFHAA
ncbi:MAG: ABC transporter ATP-binding protein [Thermodesulfobacteriota bacterium]